VLILTACGRRWSPPKTVETAYGDKFDILDEGWESRTDVPGGRIYKLTIAAPPNAGSDELQNLEHKAFQEVAGPRATVLGFRKVMIEPADPNGPATSISVDVGPGPLPHPGVYEEGGDGAWTENGVDGPAMEYVSTSTLNSGDRFGLEYAVEDFPKATYIYDCLSCVGDAAPRELFSHVREMFNEIVVPAANSEDLRNLRVVVFLGPRKTAWQFPPSIDMHLVRHANGHWFGPVASPEEFEDNYNKQMASYQEIGRRMRGETAK
jgi:hypothetical protein